MTEELHPVESCPGDADSWLKAGIRLKCPNDKFGRNLYQCAPKEDKTDLVEFCLKGSIGRYEEGLCLFAYPNRYIDAENCTTFEYGCPEKSYTSNEIYNQPACLEINREAGCYLADPPCPIDRTPMTLTGSSVSYQDGLGNVTSATTNFTTHVHSNPQNSFHVTAAVLSSLSVIGIVFGIFLFFWCRRRVRWKRRQGYLGEGSMENIPDYVDLSDKNVLRRMYLEKESIGYDIDLNQSRWETTTSERIGSLTDDQKCILYSLLAYDENKFNRSDGDQWLATLNDIRGTLFDAENVSVKDTKKDIVELMSMKLVQYNRGCLRIPYIYKVEDVIYHLWKTTKSKFIYNHSYMLTLLRVTLVRKYCKTTDQIFTGKKNLQCGHALSQSVVYRLQMDILTHPTMEDRAVRKAASWILNIPEENLQSEERLTDMYKDLRSKIDKGDIRKLGAVSWTRMTREDEDEIVYELRPQCARSTIGRHDHNDIFIVEGDMYAQKDEFHPVNGDIEDLYAVLLSDKFSIPFNRRYIFDGVTEEAGDVVRFVTDKIRRQIMFSYVVRKLLTDEDMKTFIKNASVDCLMEYGRPWRYTRREGEPCLFIPQEMEKIYLKKLGLKHLRFNVRDLWKISWKEISKMNDIPFDLCKKGGELRDQFVEYVHNEQTIQGYDLRSQEYLYSAFLFHKNGRKSAEYLEKSTWPVLLTILMSDGYQIKNNFATIPRVMGRFLDLSADHFTEALKQIRSKEDVFKVSGEQVTFASPEIKHAVMSRFVVSCLKSDEDLETYIEGSSTDSLMEYCRHWDYKRDEGEACVYIPQKFIDNYIKRLDAEVIIHVMVEDREDSDGKEKSLERRQKISKLLNIPLEVLSWNIDGRRRYLETIKLGRKKIYCARGMLVGCTGAGKTTLLRRLQGKTTAGKQQRTKTTLGLEVYENLFEIVSDTLKVHSKSAPGFHIDKQLISMTDFAGQAAYYACHQVYLSRRAVYLLLVDMSKGLKKEAHKDNTDRHNPLGSLFHHWTYEDYFIFWLQCIQTYCEDGNEKKDRRNPVILIASHKDKVRQRTGTRLAFFEKLRKSIPQQQALENLLSPDRYFEVECPPGKLRKSHEQTIEKVKQCIVETVQRLPHWGEEIPLSWAAFEDIFKERKNEKIWRRSKLRGMKEVQSMTELKIDDMLRFFHEIGQIIYFADEQLRDVIIIDVQWFVDGFKNIIADENHLARQIKDCDENLERGKVAISTLKDIWEKADASYLQHMNEIVPFMEKLGLMVEMKTSDEFYIPSMNRVDTSRIDLETISSGQKTSVLIFHFKTYLPQFFFFRLVARCFSEWSPLSKDMFNKNSAFYKNGNHSIAIAVNKTSIQLQIFTGGKEINLKTELVVEIRNKVDRIISELTETFHNKVAYGIGYACKDIQITDEDKDYFFAEKEILPVDGGISEQVCPQHPRADEKHFIKAHKLLQFWNGATVI